MINTPVSILRSLNLSRPFRRISCTRFYISPDHPRKLACCPANVNVNSTSGGANPPFPTCRIVGLGSFYRRLFQFGKIELFISRRIHRNDRPLPSPELSEMQNIQRSRKLIALVVVIRFTVLIDIFELFDPGFSQQKAPIFDPALRDAFGNALSYPENYALPRPKSTFPGPFFALPASRSALPRAQNDVTKAHFYSFSSNLLIKLWYVPQFRSKIPKPKKYTFGSTTKTRIFIPKRAF